MANETEIKEEIRSSHVIHEKDKEGQVIIDDEVCSRIAALAATETEGVDSMADNITKELIAKLSRSSLSRGVKVDVGDGVVTVFLSLVLKFGYNIPDTASRVQERVKAAIENMIGYDVKAVNVKIAGINVDAE